MPAEPQEISPDTGAGGAAALNGQAGGSRSTGSRAGAAGSGDDRAGAVSARNGRAGGAGSGRARAGAAASGGTAAGAVGARDDRAGAEGLPDIREGEDRPGVEGGEPAVCDPISAPDAEEHPRRTTRRFPLFTKDTARPEGGGRAASGDASAPARQWPVLAVLSVVALGLLLTALDAFRIGTILVGTALLAGAVLRWVLPGVGMLAVRSRFTDIVTYGVLGAVIVLLALMAQPNPWLQVPFLKDTLHFTVSS